MTLSRYGEVGDSVSGQSIIYCGRAEEVGMVTHFDHVTIVVRDVEKAKQFFGLLGFQEE